MHGRGAVVLVLASVDQASPLHERLIDPVGGALGTSGALRHAWVPRLALVVVLTIAFAGFESRRPARARRGGARTA